MTTPGADTVFVDTNILVYTCFPASPFHAAARDAIDSHLDRGFTVCASNQILREFMVCTTRPGIMTEPMPRDEALDLAEDFRDRFRILTDDEAVGTRLIKLLREVACSGKQVHDANIVATMLEAGVATLLTGNLKDFKRFEPFVTVVDFADVAKP